MYRINITAEEITPESRKGAGDAVLKWSINPQHYKNNHSIDLALLSAHPGARRLSDNEIKRVVDLNISGAKIQYILRNLQQTNPANLATAKDIYNIIGRVKLGELDGTRSSIEALIDMLRKKDGGEREMWVSEVKLDEENKYINISYLLHSIQICY